MGNEKYIIHIGKDGSEGLGKLDYLYNQTTQDFLLHSGLKPGMTLLDIGCGSGVMTCWMAQQVGAKGHVIAIENDINQLNAAKHRAEKLALNNIEFKLCSAYELESLAQTFDFVYCRFVLHHLHKRTDVIKQIFTVLNKNGIYAAEEGIVNFAFSYPFSSAWGDDSMRCKPIWEDIDENQRDPNVGVKMFRKMRAAGFKITSAKIIHPLLITQEEKTLLLLGREEMKEYYLGQGHSEKEWETHGKETESIVNDDDQIIGFYGSCQTAGLKTA